MTLRLRPKYVALPQKRFDVVDEGTVAIESIYPDVGVVGLTLPTSETIGQAVGTAPYVLQTVMEAQAPHVWVEIREAAGKRLVTTIEILSPWNKRGQGRVEYLDKRPICSTALRTWSKSICCAEAAACR